MKTKPSSIGILPHCLLDGIPRAVESILPTSFFRYPSPNVTDWKRTPFLATDFVPVLVPNSPAQKDKKIVKNQDGGLKVPLFDLRLAMSCLDDKI